MKAFFRIVAIVLLSIPGISFAVVAPPAQTVWITPSDAAPKTKVDINAFVYNNTKNEVVTTVTFSAKGVDIGTVVVTIAKESGKTASIVWAMPETKTPVTATITKAVNTKDKKEVVTLKGVLGTVEVGTTALVAINGFPGEMAIKEWFTTHFASIEVWRTKEASRFAEMRDQAKHDLGITIARSIEVKVAKEIAGVEPDKIAVSESQNNPKDYMILIGATALASLLASILMFYTVAVVLALWIIRFIIRRFI